MPPRPFFRVRRVFLRWVGGALLLLAILLLAACLTGYFLIRASLPSLDGGRRLPALTAQVTVERDGNGIPTIHAANREDLFRTLGFLHAQDRFFQMDLTRRQAAGELSELFGPAALSLDRKQRRNRFRHQAPAILARFSADQLRVLDAYVAGVNSGLADLHARPWEYLVLRTMPRPWTREDTVLVIDAMAISLQDPADGDERSRAAILDTYGETALAFLKPPLLAASAAIDGSGASAPPVPDASQMTARPLPPGFRPPAPVAFASPENQSGVDDPPRPGSNSFALGGARVAGGGALVANDMHLGLSLPHIWYRASLALPGRTGTGTTLPGVPALATGSNGDIAWGFTDAYIDNCDLVVIETGPADATRYRVPDGGGWEKIETVRETIQVAGGPPQVLEIPMTRWGPLLAGVHDAAGHPLATHWLGNEPEAINLGLCDLFDARTVDEAVEIAHRSALPTENFVVGDRQGIIAWTLIGPVPRRVGFDGHLPRSWADGTCRWDGLLPADRIPVIRNPDAGQVWTANNRVVGGEALALLGDGGYDYPARAAQIRDRLTALAGRSVAPADLLAVQLDDESRYLARWRDLLVGVLNDDALQGDLSLAELRRLTLQWHGHASPDEPGHWLVREFRRIVAQAVIDPIMGPVKQRDPEAYLSPEQPLWSILTERPAYLLPEGVASWDALLLRAAHETAHLGDRQPGGKVALRDCTWGRANTLAMRHPFSRGLPAWAARWLDMPADPLPGDNNMPRVQTPIFGASERMVVSPGRESEGIYHQPGGASGNPLSPFYRAGHADWAQGRATPFLPGRTEHSLTLESARAR